MTARIDHPQVLQQRPHIAPDNRLLRDIRVKDIYRLAYDALNIFAAAYTLHTLNSESTLGNYANCIATCMCAVIWINDEEKHPYWLSYVLISAFVNPFVFPISFDK